MRLYYYRSRNGNIGDDLNAVLWPAVLGQSFFNPGDGRIFLGIGSIFDNRPEIRGPRATIVFGSGLRGRHKTPSDMARFDIRFLRGPLSARALGQGGLPYISDPAVIAPLYLPPKPQVRTARLGYVPYFMSPDHVNRAIADAIGAKIIPPTLPVRQFIDEIAGCDKILSEAMHGAILADAYRIPWAGCRMFSGIFDGYTNIFKWRDWMQSLSIEGRIGGPVADIAFCTPRRIRRLLAGYVAEKAALSAQAMVKDDPWTLSGSRNLAEAQERIQHEAEKLKRQYPSA